MNTLNGVPVTFVADILLPPILENKQFRFPKSKRKRIQNKFKNNTVNYRKVSKDQIIYQKLDNGIVYHVLMSVSLYNKTFKCLDAEVT